MKTSMRHRNISAAPSSSRDHLAAESRVHSEHAVVITGLKLISPQSIEQTEAEGALTKIDTCEEFPFRALTLAKPASLKETAPDMTGAIQHSTDEELVIAAQNGILHALNELLARHRSLVYQTVRRLASTAEETDDVVQEAMLRAFINIGKIPTRIWFFVMADRNCHELCIVFPKEIETCSMDVSGRYGRTISWMAQLCFAGHPTNTREGVYRPRTSEAYPVRDKETISTISLCFGNTRS
jgi:hypothetical protein